MSRNTLINFHAIVITRNLNFSLLFREDSPDPLSMHNNLTEIDRSNCVGIARKQCRHLTQFVKEAFELSKLNAGNIVPTNENLSLAGLLQDLLQKYSLIAKQKTQRYPC